MTRPSSYQPSDASATHTRSRRSSSFYDGGDDTAGGSAGRRGSKGGEITGGGSAANVDTTLDEHLSIRNKRAMTSRAAASLYEIMDIASLDKTGPATWASSDWCAEARKSRAYLRKVKADVNANGTVGVDGGGGRGGTRTDDDDDDDARGGVHARRGSRNDGDDAHDGRSYSRGGTAVEGDETRGKVDGSVGGGRSNYRSSASLPPLRRHDEDDDDGEDDDDDNGTFRTVSRGRWMDRDAPPPPAPMGHSISGGATRSQSNGGGRSEYYRIPRREQRPEDMRRPSPPRSPSPSSRGGSEYRMPRHQHSQSRQVQQPVQRLPSSSRSQSRGPPPPNDVGRQRNEDGIIAGNVGNGRSVRSSTPGRIDDRSVRSSTTGGANDRPIRSATPGRIPSSGYDNSSARSSSRSRTAEMERRAAYRDKGGDVGLGVGDGVGDVDDSRSVRTSTFHRADTIRSRGKSSGAEGRGRIGDPPMESWDSRSSSRHSIRRHEADSRRDRGEWQRREEPRRRSSSRGGRIARSPPRDPSSERRSVSRTPSRRGESEPQGRSSSGRSYVGVGMSIDKSIRRGGNQSQAFGDRYASRATPSSRDEKSLPPSPHEHTQKIQQQGERHRQDTGDATDDSFSTESSKQPIKTSSSTRKSSERHINSKATVISARSYSSSGTSDTPDTGPLTSSSGKSSKGSFLKSRISSFVGVGGNMTPPTPPQKIVSDSRPFAPSKGLDMDNEEIATCLFDSKGYCIRHPNVQLRKKKLLGGWNVMMINCPECCMEEMKRLKRVSKRMVEKDGATGGGIGGSGNEKNTKSTKKGPRVVPDREQKERSSYRSPVGRSRSRSQSQKEAQDATDTTGARNSKSRSKSKSRQDRRSTPRNETACNKSPPVFEFDVPLDVHGDLISSRSSAPRSIKSHKSGSSKKSKQSGRSAKTNKSAKSTRTNKSGKSTRTNKTSKSMTGHGSSIKRQPRDHSNNSKRETRGRSSSVNKNKGKSRDSNNRSVSRESSRGPSQRVTRQGTKLCVAKMPFKDQYNREGSYTGEVNDYGQPNGHGKIKYKNGTEFEGKFKDGRSDEMDASMEKPKNGFSNWKSNTKTGKMEKEKRKELESDDLRSFVDPIVRSGSSAAGGGIGSQQGTYCNTPTNKKGVAVHGRVNDMKWSDVNGFSGLYTGDVNSQKVPDGCGIMQYTNGVVEEGLFCNGVFQPGPLPNSNHYGGDNGGVPSSSMSVWSLKSTPTMAFGQANHSVLEGHNDRVNSGLGASSVRGTPSSVHLSGPGVLYGNNDQV